MNSALYREPVLIDSQQHRHKKLRALDDYSITKDMHAVFVAATEFVNAALDFPIIFVATGEKDASGRAVVSPVALLGLTAGENLNVDGTRWDARYLPAFIRRYPFFTGNVQGSDAPAVFIDNAWSGFNDDSGEPLFDAEGKPAAALTHAIEFLQRFENEAALTRQFCARIAELDLLKEMKADATLPDGRSLSVDGFLAVDEEKLRALPDATVLELQRNGSLLLLHTHLVSLNNMRHLLARKAARETKTA